MRTDSVWISTFFRMFTLKDEETKQLSRGFKRPGDGVLLDRWCSENLGKLVQAKWVKRSIYKGLGHTPNFMRIQGMGKDLLQRPIDYPPRDARLV
ncbi:hypothetical protein TWF730_006181 [Orbilia blumenaviensis]|uniref:Rna-directed dna polymerase from mobile element jockey-like n=1 Tax=Orbilia blumenaviensis TaxID=1796055 RepID=A0AAV9TY33_9PEZI